MKDVRNPNQELNSSQREQSVKRAGHTPGKGKMPMACVCQSRENGQDELQETGGHLSKCRPHRWRNEQQSNSTGNQGRFQQSSNSQVPAVGIHSEQCAIG